MRDHKSDRLKTLERKDSKVGKKIVRTAIKDRRTSDKKRVTVGDRKYVIKIAKKRAVR